MTLPELLDEIGDDLVKEIQTNLIKADKSATGKLVKSIDYRLIVSESQRLVRQLRIEILGEDYLKWVDEGRRPGAKMPPPQKLDKWIVARRIAPRDAQGRFISRKSLQFLIARSISKKGIKATNVLDKSVKTILSKYKEKLNAAAVEEFNEIITKFFEK